MRRDEQVHPRFEVGEYLGLPVGHHSRGGVLKALTVGGTNVETPSPDVHLLVAVFLSGLRLVETLKVAIVTLVERLIALRRQVRLADDGKRNVRRSDGAFQDGRVDLVEGRVFQFLSGLLRLDLAFGTEVDVYPTREAILEVPLLLAVS